MGWLTGALGLNDTDRSYINTIGADVVFDAVQRQLALYNAELEASMALFVEETTENYKERYYLPGGGRLQERSSLTPSHAVKANGSWDVAYPIKEYGATVSESRVARAYMTVQQMQRHVDTVTMQDANTMRFIIMQALANSGTRTFTDPDWGNLTIQPLANGDSVLYPPVLGAETEATENNYLGLNYVTISDTNNPFTTIVNKLEPHFGTPTGGSRIVCFVNNAQTASIQAMADFNTITNRFVVPGTNVDTVTGVPGELSRGTWRILGVSELSGAVIVEWRFIPAGYILGLHLDAPKPLKMRVDPATTNLGRGLQLVNQDDDHPFRTSHWEHRLGFGVGNRLNGVAAQLVASTSYTTPTVFA